MKATTIGRDAVLAIPGRHERAALTDWCDCTVPAEPVAVAADDHGRVAAYRCSVCGDSWLCWWAKRLPDEPPRRRRDETERMHRGSSA